MRAPGALRTIDSPQALGGTATSTHTAWIVAAFVMTALWALVVVVNKKALESVTPLAVNFFIRLVAIGGLLAITIPLTVLHLWSNGFGINAAAAGWIALAAVGTWVVAFNAYYFALRGERVAVVAPITSTDPIWTAFFAWVIVGTAFGAPTLVGMVVTMAGVVLISRWMDDGEDAPGAELTGAAALAGAAHGEVLPDERPAAAVAATRSAGAGAGAAAPAPTSSPGAVTTAPASSPGAVTTAPASSPGAVTTAPASPPGAPASAPVAGGTATTGTAKARLIGLAVLTAAGWGLGPVLIQLAADAYGRATATMMLLSQVCGALMLGAILLLRRQALTTGPLTPAARRGAVWLIVLAGLLEAAVSVLFYLTIVALGPLLAMLIMATTPVFSIVFGVVFLRERPGWRLTLAAVVTVAGVLIATLDGLH
jgi:drug/metabolite transporter (DMT)-like permease